MKRKTVLLAIATVAISIICLETVNSKIALPPAGNDGDPTSLPVPNQTCAQCHSGNAVQPAAGHVGILFSDFQSTYSIDTFMYRPGTQYTVSFQHLVPAVRHGFQLSALTSANQNAGTLDTIAGTITTSLTSGAPPGFTRYIGHRNAFTTANWNFNWTAPATDVGAINFYYAINAGNGDIDDTGDTVYTGMTTVSVDTAWSGIHETALERSVAVFPNPAKDWMTIQLDKGIAAVDAIDFYTLDGKRVLAVEKPHTLNCVSVAALPSGVYLLKIATDKGSVSKKIVKE